MSKENIIVNRIKGARYAFKGAWLLVRTEASIKAQLFIAIIMTLLGFYFQISTIEWIIQILAVGMVMGTEGLNTAVEKLADFVEPNHNPKIGFIKDVSAGAVMLVSIAASIVGLIIYIPKIF